MLEKYIPPAGIQVQKFCADWETAVDMGAQPLLAAGVIEARYIEAIKKNHRQLPYMVIAPGIMLAHARPDCGALSVGLSILTLSEGIAFGSELNDPVRLVLTLATPDEKSHFGMLEQLMDFLMTEGKVDALLAAGSLDAAWAEVRGA